MRWSCGLRWSPAPVGPGELGELEGLADRTRRGHVRAAAQVEPLALLVDLEVLALGNGVDQLDLEQLALLLEEVLGLLPAPHLLGEGRIALDDLVHLGFDARDVVGMERLGLGEVVVEAVLDHRTDGHLGAGPQRLHGFRHHMRAVVANELERLRIGAHDDSDRRVRIDGIGEVGEPPVDHHRHRLLGERLGDRACKLAPGDAAPVGPLAAVGKRQGDLAHGAISSHSLHTAQVRWLEAGDRASTPTRASLCPRSAASVKAYGSDSSIGHSDTKATQIRPICLAVGLCCASLGAVRKRGPIWGGWAVRPTNTGMSVYGFEGEEK